MGVIRWVGYVLGAVLVLVLVIVGGGILSALLTVFALFLIAAAVVAFLAVCIKEYCEPPPNDPERGNKEPKSQGRP